MNINLDSKERTIANYLKRDKTVVVLGDFINTVECVNRLAKVASLYDPSLNIYTNVLPEDLAQLPNLFFDDQHRELGPNDRLITAVTHQICDEDCPVVLDHPVDVTIRLLPVAANIVIDGCTYYVDIFPDKVFRPTRAQKDLMSTDWKVIRELERKYLAGTDLNLEREQLRLQLDVELARPGN